MPSYPTTVNFEPLRVNWVPDVLTKPVGTAVGVADVLVRVVDVIVVVPGRVVVVAVVVILVVVELDDDAVPGRHCEYHGFE